MPLLVRQEDPHRGPHGHQQVGPGRPQDHEGEHRVPRCSPHGDTDHPRTHADGGRGPDHGLREEEQESREQCGEKARQLTREFQEPASVCLDVERIAEEVVERRLENPARDAHQHHRDEKQSQLRVDSTENTLSLGRHLHPGILGADRCNRQGETATIRRLVVSSAGRTESYFVAGLELSSGGGMQKGLATRSSISFCRCAGPLRVWRTFSEIHWTYSFIERRGGSASTCLSRLFMVLEVRQLVLVSTHRSQAFRNDRREVGYPIQCPGCSESSGRLCPADPCPCVGRYPVRRRRSSWQ